MTNIEITKEDLPEAMKEITDIIGLKNTLAVMKLFSGVQVYIPKPSTALIKAKHRLIRADKKKGLGYAELSQKYHLSASRIRDIINGRLLSRKR